jgi:glycosyltransferase involved in cell wall biosynthesis
VEQVLGGETILSIEGDVMEVMVVPDGHYYKLPSGEVYVESVFNYEFFARYLSVFDKVYVLGRITYVDKAPNNMKLASGNKVEFLDFPAFKGPWQYLRNYKTVKKLAKSYSNRFDCAIFRVPGATANIISREFISTKKPFAVEVVVDPWEYFRKGTIKSIARPIVRLSWTNYLKRICKIANGVSYVTREYLQKKYPSHSIINGETEEYFSTHYSSVSIRKDSYGNPKKYLDKSSYVITHAANSFTTYGKGHITLMKALKILRDNNHDVRIIFIGDGPLKENFIEFSKELGVSEHVKFIGRLPDGNEVRNVISKSDLFVFPTMAEGLPRVILEAMSVGLPCISSPVSGIPEILNKEFLIDYDDYQGYANKIMELINDKELLEEASINNIKVAQEYSEETLNMRREIFFRKLSDLSKNSIKK